MITSDIWNDSSYVDWISAVQKPVVFGTNQGDKNRWTKGFKLADNIFH